MIYLWTEPDYDNTIVRNVYEAPEALDLSEGAFLVSLGLRRRPEDCSATEGNHWWEERRAVLAANGVAQVSEAHHAWIAKHPEVRELEFTEL